MLNKHVLQPVCLTVGFARRNLKFTLFSCWLIVLLPTGKNLLRTVSVNILHLLQKYENEIKIRWQMFQRWGLLILRWHTARPFWDIFLWLQFSIIVTNVISSKLISYQDVFIYSRCLILQPCTSSWFDHKFTIAQLLLHCDGAAFFCPYPCNVQVQ